MLLLSGGLFFAENSINPVTFPEIWAYLINGEEQYLDISYPISDLGYFGAGISTYGALTGVPNLAKIAFFLGKKHLVVAETGNAALTHFCLDPQYRLRDPLIRDIITASLPYDGVQIDFEMVPLRDTDNFIDFLKLLKGFLGTKTLSVALPARWRTVGDSYDYARIGAVADKIIVMAYDEHWSGGVPGSIASLDWCANVSAYALSKIGRDKLVMGLPFYGRAWIDTNPAKAYKHSSISKLVLDKNISTLLRNKDIPYFEYLETVKVQVFYEDAVSTILRLNLYKTATVKGISFWRLGQEDPEVWKFMSVEK